MNRGKVLRLRRLEYASALVILYVLLAGCLPIPQPSETEQRIFRAMLQLSDFPQGWRAGRGVIDDEEGTISRARSYRGSPDLERYSVLVSHQVNVYANEKAAFDAYPTLETEEFPTTTWANPEELSYQSMSADQFRLACIPVSISGVSAHSCTTLGQYGDMISVLYANVFEDRWFTWEDMERILQVIDQRMAAEKE